MLLLHTCTAEQSSRFLWSVVVVAAVVLRKSCYYIAQTSLQLTILSTRIKAHSTMPTFRSLMFRRGLGESWGEPGYTAVISTKQPLQQTEWRQTEDSIDLLARQEGCMENYKAHLPHGNKESIFFCLLRARLKKRFRHAPLCHLPMYKRMQLMHLLAGAWKASRVCRIIPWNWSQRSLWTPNMGTGGCSLKGWQTLLTMEPPLKGPYIYK